MPKRPPGVGVASPTRSPVTLSSVRWADQAPRTNHRGGSVVPEAGVEFHRVTCYLTLGNPVSFLAAILGGLRAGEPVDIATGIFTMEKIDLVLPDVIPIVIKREYRQNDTVARNGEYGVSRAFSTR